MPSHRMRISCGRLISLICVVLVLDGVVFWAMAGIWRHRVNAQKRMIETRYTFWHTAMKEQRFSHAYALMAPAYRGSNSLEQFTSEFQSIGKEFPLSQKRILRVRGSKARLIPVETHWYWLWCGPEFGWTRIGGQWFLSGEYVYYYN